MQFPKCLKAKGPAAGRRKPRRHRRQDHALAAARQMVNKLSVCLHRASPRLDPTLRESRQGCTARWLLAWRPEAPAAHLARLLIVVATLACLRANEVALLQVCDLWFDHLTGYGVPGYKGTCSLHVTRRKKDRDTLRKGHWPAPCCSRDPELDIVQQLLVWLRPSGLSASADCSKRERPAARCSCPPLFPLTRRGPGRVTVVTERSLQLMGDMIRWAVAQPGVSLASSPVRADIAWAFRPESTCTRRRPPAR